MNAALNRVKPQPEHYEMYYLHVVKEQPAHEVARTSGVSAVQVYLARHRVGAALRSELKQLPGNLRLETKAAAGWRQLR